MLLFPTLRGDRRQEYSESFTQHLKLIGTLRHLLLFSTLDASAHRWSHGLSSLLTASAPIATRPPYSPYLFVFVLLAPKNLGRDLSKQDRKLSQQILIRQNMMKSHENHQNQTKHKKCQENESVDSSQILIPLRCLVGHFHLHSHSCSDFHLDLHAYLYSSSSSQFHINVPIHISYANYRSSYHFGEKLKPCSISAGVLQVFIMLGKTISYHSHYIAFYTTLS